MVITSEQFIRREEKLDDHRDRPVQPDQLPWPDAYAEFPFLDLIQCRRGVEYFFEHYQNYHGLSSRDAFALLDLVTGSDLPLFIEASVAFEPLDNTILDYLLMRGDLYIIHSLAAKKRFLPLEESAIFSLLRSSIVEEEDFEALIPIMKVPVSDKVLFKLLHDWRHRWIHELGQKLDPEFTEEKFKIKCAKTGYLREYFQYLDWWESNTPDDQALKIKEDIFKDEKVLDEIIQAKSPLSMRAYLEESKKWRYLPIAWAGKILKFIELYMPNDLGDYLARRDQYFEYVDEKFIQELLKHVSIQSIVAQISAIHGLNRDAIDKILDAGFSLEVILSNTSHFARNVWTKDLVMRLADRRASLLEMESVLPNLIVNNLVGMDEELANRLIAVGWGTNLIEYSRDENHQFTFTSDHLDKMLAVYQTEKKVMAADQSGQGRVFKSKENLEHYLRGISCHIGDLSFEFSVEQAEVLWNNGEIRNLLIHCDKVTPEFYTKARMQELLETRKGTDFFLLYAHHLNNHKRVTLDDDLFKRAMKHATMRTLWDNRFLFNGVIFDEVVARKLIASKMEYDLAVAINDFNKFDNDDVYREMFERGEQLTSPTLELLLKAIRSRCPDRMTDILKGLDVSVAFGEVDETKRKEDDDSELIPKIKGFKVLDKLLDMNDFDGVDDWLAVFEGRKVDDFVSWFFTNRLKELAVRSEWRNAEQLLAMMTKHNIDINKDFLINNELVKILSSEGAIVADPEEQRLISFLQGINPYHQGVLVRLRQTKPKDILLDKLLIQTAHRRSAIEDEKRQTNVEQAVYEGQPLNILDQTVLYYTKEYVRSVTDQVNDRLRVAGQELSFEKQREIGEATNHDTLALWMRDYLVSSLDHELEYGRTAKGIRLNWSHSAGSYDDLRKMIKTMTTEQVLEYLDRAEAVYRDENIWGQSTSYGGVKWAEITKWTRLLVIAIESHDDHALRHAMDTIFSLQHNTDSVFNKNLFDLIKGDHSQIKEVLDIKFNSPRLIDSVADLKALVTMETRQQMDEILATLKVLPGYDYSAHSIRADINWSMVRGAKPRGD